MIIQNSFLQICLLVIFSICPAVSISAFDVWESLGPEGGAISAIALAEADTQIIYAATGNGIYKSTNGGGRWQRSSNGLSSFPSVHSPLAINGNSIYVGTSDGIYRSIDAGEAWELISEVVTDVACLAIAPKELNVIYAAAGIQQSRIFRSSDYGESWVSIDESLGPGRFYSISVHPRDSDIIYVARENTFIEQNTRVEWKKGGMGLISTGIWCVAADSRDVYVGTSAGVFKSSDGCRTFSMISSELPPNITIVAIAQPDTIYAYSPGNGLYKSDDGGSSWQLLSGELGTAKCLAFASPDNIYAGTQGRGIYKSVDGGKTWKAINSGLRNFDVLSLARARAGDLYVSSKYGGLHKSIDGGDSWRSLGLNGLLVENMAVGQLDGIYANIDNGLYRSAKMGSDWERITTGPDDVITFDLAIHPSEPSTIYAATWGDGVYRSNNGEDWREMSEGLIDRRVSSIEIAPSNHEVLYAQTYHGILHSSEDAGRSWSRIENPVAGSEISLLAIAPRQAGTIYVKAGDSLFKSANFGRNFNWITVPHDSIPLALAIDEFRRETLYLGARNLTTGECKIYRSLDNGESWFPLGNGFPNVMVNILSIDPVSPNIVYAGTSGGVFRLTQRAPGEDDETRISSVINYPNPFASSQGTTFRYTLPYDSLVTIRIFNMAGVFIRTITEDTAKSSGVQEDTWDGRDEQGNSVSSGMYIYNIAANSVLDEDNVFKISKILLVRP
ncbi:FlgD immunoglobulin-like domain containing protein [Candidatus Poribacteria bacterium]